MSSTPATPHTSGASRPRRLCAGLLSAILPAALLVAAAPAADARATAEPTATATIVQADSEGLKFNVKGSGFSGEDPGLYIGLTEAGPVDPANAGSYHGTVWQQPSGITGGSFDTDLELITPEEIDKLDRDADYEIHTQKAHGQSAADPSQNVRIPVEIDFSVWDEASGAPSAARTTSDVAAPTATASIVQADSEGLKFNVKGSGYSGATPGIYIGLTEAGPVDPANAGNYHGTVWLPPTGFTNGSFDTDLKLITPEEIDKLDPDADYEIHTQKAHGQSAADPSQNVRIPVEIDFSVWKEKEPAETTISAKNVETSYGRSTTATAAVPGARGKVTLTIAGQTKTTWVKDDRASFVIPRSLTAKIYTARWNYLGTSDFAPSTTTSRVAVRSAATKSSVTFKAPTTRAGGRADLRVASTASAYSPTGKVTLRLTRAGRTLSYTRTLHSGRTHVTLPRMSKGTWKAVATYAGAPSKFLKSSKTSSLKVVR